MIYRSLPVFYERLGLKNKRQKQELHHTNSMN